jgi:2-succinyl-6-hydroxy-2,4-cyclohexadiene-1-carboxylate synthase
MPLALDLPGHGECRHAERPITFAGCVDSVLSRSPERFTLCGYSMGGRIALEVALKAPHRVGRLLLISSTAGIEDATERGARVEADERLAAELEEGPYERFIDRWRTQPLFAKDPVRVNELARADQRRNDPDALAAVLRGIGTGRMKPLWRRLGELEIPVSVLVGERDLKFRRLAEQMVGALPDADLVLLDGGHNLALESPSAIARVLDEAPHASGGRSHQAVL